MISIKMSERTLKFDNIRVNKKEFHKSKQLINLDLNVGQIIVSDKFKHKDDGILVLLVAKKMKLLNHCVLFCLK